MIRRALFLLALCLLTKAASAQSNPGWTFGFIPSAAQWNNQWALKTDTSGGTLTNGTIAGGTFTGTQTFASAPTGAGITSLLSPYALSSSVGTSVTPTGAPSTLTLGALAAQQGVLLDTFKVSGDADDTASMTRAVAAGVPILLGPKTYTVNNYSMAGSPASFVLRGVPGKSVIQRTSASGSQFFTITAANVVIDGVTFDMNRSAVTANQWGVFVGSCGQTVSILHSLFENNGGTLGTGLAHICTAGTVSAGSFDISDNEFTGNAWNSLYMGSVANGVVSRNYIHDNDNDTTAVFVSSYLTATATNYAADITIEDNRVFRNGTGIGLGGYGVPYSFAVSPAFRVFANNNTLVDNATYGISLECDYCSASNNRIAQSTPSVTIFGGIDALSRYGLISDNVVTLLNAPWGIDVGGSVQMTLSDNVVTMNQGTGLNVGGNLNTAVKHNHVIMSGSGHAISATAIETDGNLNVFPTIPSNITITDNSIDLSGSSSVGISLVDNVGGLAGTGPTIVRHNHITTSGSGSGSFQAVQWQGGPNSLIIEGNDLNGPLAAFSDPNVNGDILVDTVQIGGYTIYGSNAGNTTAIRTITTSQVSSFGSGGSILYAYPTSGGSGYTSATTLTASGTGGGSGWTGLPMIYGGVIIGVRTLTQGSGYIGTVTITASDTGGGSGAVIFAGNVPGVPNYSKLTYVPNNTTHLLQVTGGYTRINYPHTILLDGTSALTLQVLNGGSFWSVIDYTLPTFAIGSLPTCGSTSVGVQINVTGATSGAWQARCNGTNWINPAGSTIS